MIDDAFDHLRQGLTVLQAAVGADRVLRDQHVRLALLDVRESLRLATEAGREDIAAALTVAIKNLERSCE